MDITNTTQKTDELTFAIIKNPLNLEETIFESREWEAATTLYEYLGDIEGAWVILHNYDQISIEESKGIYPERGDLVTLSVIPQGDTFRSVLAIAAIVVISYFTFGAGGIAAGGLEGALGAGFAAGSFGAYALASAVFIGGALLVNAVLGPGEVDPPDTFESSPSYGIDGPKNTSTAGIPTPVVVGPYRMGGNIIALHTTKGEDSLGGKDPIQADFTLDYATLAEFNFSLSLLSGYGYTGGVSYRANENEQFLYMLINAGEGEIEGVQDIEINDQPISNFENAEWVMRAGVDNQEVINSFRQIYTPISVVATMDVNSVYTERQTLNAVDKLRVDFVCPAGLYGIGKNTGDQFAQHFNLWIHIKEQSSGTWLNMVDLSVADGVAKPYYVEKNSTEPVRLSFHSPKLPPGIYDVRCKRDNQPATRVNTNLTWSDLVEVNLETVRYNHTALMGLKVKLDDQLNAIPKVTFIHRGIKLRNYDEASELWQVTRTSNAAWVAYNLLTNVRWGGGIPEANIDEFAFREWAQHCETNNLEWRGIFDRQGSLWDLLKPVLRAGRASLVRIGTTYTVSVEQAKEPVMTFNSSNIIEGTFSQNWLPLDGRANEISADYYDRDDGYRKKTTKVVNQAEQDRVGFAIPANLNLIGVDNLDQAEREAQFALNMNSLISTVSFSAPLEAIGVAIGDVVNVQHDQPEWGVGGRFKTGSTVSVGVLDREVEVVSGTYELMVVFNSLVRLASTVSSVVSNVVYITGLDWTTITGNPKTVVINGNEHTIRRRVVSSPHDGVEIDDATGIVAAQSANVVQTDATETKTISNGVGVYTTVNVTTPFSQAPSQYDKWIFGGVNQSAVKYTVRDIKTNSEDLQVDLSLLEYNDGIFNTTPGNTVTPYSYVTDALLPVTFSGSPITESALPSGNVRRYKVTIAWSHDSFRYKDANVYVSRNGNAFSNVGGFWVTSYSTEAEAGEVLRFLVVPRSIERIISPTDAQTPQTYTVVGTDPGTPEEPVGFASAGSTASVVNLEWPGSLFDPAWTYEIAVIADSGGLSASQKIVANAVRLTYTPTLEYTHSGLSANTEYTYWLRVVSVLNPTFTSAWVGGTNGISVTTLSSSNVVIFYQSLPPSGAGEKSGDYWIDSDDNKMYIYNAGGPSWDEIQDADIASALAAAQSAQTTADGKIVTFAQNTPPVAEGDGDIWMDTDDDNKLYRWDAIGVAWVPYAQDSADWTKVFGAGRPEDNATVGADWDTNLTNIPSQIRSIFYQSLAPTANQTGDYWIDSDDDTLWVWDGAIWVQVQDVDIQNAISDAATAQATADGKIVSFAQPAQPTAEGVGDIWVDTDDGNRTYRWSGSVWIDIRDTGIAQALTDASNAQATADGKIITYAQPAEPGGGTVGDIWVDTDDNNKLYRHNGTIWVDIQDGDVTAAQADATQAIADALTAQSTADGKVTTFVQASPPTAEGVGDLWMDTDDGYRIYRWSGGNWVDVRDTGIAQALSDASNAQATADGKIVTFIQPAAPTAEGVGDIWVDSDDNNRLYRWSGSVWTDIRDGGVAQAVADAAQAITDASTAQATADGKVTTFIQPAAPTAEGVGDLWVDSDDGNKLYRWGGATWDVIQDSGIATAISDAANAQATADGKIVTFYQPAAPTADGVGDLWVDTDDNNRLYRWNGATWDSIRDGLITTAQADASQAISDAATAQATADGKVTTFIQPAAPTAEGVGDLWIDSDDGNKLYRWGGATWDVIQDTGIATAISDASNAQATADGKIVSFYQTTPPTAEGIGDLWVDTDDNNKLYRWNGSWVSVQDGTITAAQVDATQALADAAIAQSTADGKVTTFVQPAAPTAEGVGDLWIDSDDSNKLYRWSGSTWDSIQDGGIGQALTDASNAQATADGKIVTFAQASAPTADGVGDVWIDTDDNNKLYRWGGATWDSIQDGTISTAQADATQALADAATASGIASAKVTTFVQASPPTALATGDLWMDTDDDNKIYRWSGSTWDPYAQDTADWAKVFSRPTDAELLNSYNAGKTITLKINSNNDGTLNNGEFTVAAVDNTGTPDFTASGFIMWQGAIVTVPRLTEETSQASIKGFIAFDTGLGTPFTVSAVPRNVAFVWKVGAQWKYDNGAGTTDFTPTSSYVALGWLQTSTADLIAAGGLLGEPVTLTLAAFPAATEGAPSGTPVGALPDADNVSDTIDAAGSLNSTVSAGDGNNYRAVTRGMGFGTAQDNDAVTFSPTWTDVPAVRFMSGGLIDNASLSGDLTTDFAALSLSGSGFTAKLKITELVGATTLRTDSTVSTPSSPAGLDKSINKVQTDEAYDDNYRFQYDVTITNNYEIELGFWLPGQITVGIYTNDGGGWVLRGSPSHNGTSFEATTTLLNRTYDVVVDGLGLNDDFGLDLTSSYYGGTINFDNVTYYTAVTPSTESATPAGAAEVQYIVLGGST